MASILRTQQNLWRYYTAKTTVQNGSIRMYSKNATGIRRATHRLIVEKIGKSGDEYPIEEMVPVAEEVLTARTRLIKGVSTLLQCVPVWTCMHCPEVHIGETGHLIKTCCGFTRRARGSEHEWVQAGLNDIVVPVTASLLQTKFQDAAEHRKKFSHNYLNRVPAVVDLCLEAGAFQSDEELIKSQLNFDRDVNKLLGNRSLSPFVGNTALSVADQEVVAQGTLCAYEAVRSGIEKLLLAYPVKVWTHHSESPLGPSGRKPRRCDEFKIKTWKWTPDLRNAEVDDLVPQKVVWFQRPQEPPLMNAYKEFYGRAPAVVDLCTKAGAIPPSKYLSMMKMGDFAPPSQVLALEED